MSISTASMFVGIDDGAALREMTKTHDGSFYFQKSTDISMQLDMFTSSILRIFAIASAAKFFQLVSMYASVRSLCLILRRKTDHGNHALICDDGTELRHTALQLVWASPYLRGRRFHRDNGSVYCCTCSRVSERMSSVSPAGYIDRK